MDLTIDRYQVRRLIGQGAMGKIYLATDPKLGRDVAIKMISAQVSERAVRDRFRLEARAIAALKHPNIVELYDYSGEHAEDLFLVLEYVPGPTLQDLINQRGPMSEVTALCIGHELVLALEHAHRAGVVHRDLKPDNVLLFQGRVVLTDFGIVKQIAQGAPGLIGERTATAVGTPGFMAPEQAEGKTVGPQSDLFALGALLYHLVTGAPPFEGSSVIAIAENAKKGRFVDPRAKNPMLSQGFCELIAGCLAPKPKDRFADADTVRVLILDVLRAHGVSEVRSEIVDYEQNPAKQAIDQRQRSLDVLLRDLKLAIRDGNEPQVQAIVERMRTLAPLDREVKDLTGLRWDKDRVLLSHQLKNRRRWPFVVLGLGLGMPLGALVCLALLVVGYLPTSWVAWMEQAMMRLGLMP